MHNIKIALLGPIVPTSNPIRVAEELAMLDTLAPGRIVVGLLRGTTNEYLSYDLNPAEARERTDEGMELILKAWTEPQPFGWQGRYFQYRTVSIWPRPQQPPAPTYILGTSAEAGAFAARHHCGLGVSYGNFESMGQSTAYYRQQCAQYGWTPGPDDIIYRANMILGETDDAAEAALQRRDKQAPFPVQRRIGRRAAQRRHHAQHRGGKAAGQCRRRAADQLLRRTGPDRRANQAVPRNDRRRRARPVVAGPWRRRHGRDDGAGWTCSGAKSCHASATFEGSRIVADKLADKIAADRIVADNETAATFSEAFVEADGFRIRYMAAGQGTPLIHLHGAGGPAAEPRP